MIHMGNAGKDVRSNKRNPPTPQGGKCPPDFETFWKAWPKHHRKTDKAKVFSKWRVAVIEKSVATDVILSSLEEWKASDQWTKDEGNFIPAPKAWLHQGQYTAEFDTGPGPDSPEVRAAVVQYRKAVDEDKVPAGHARSRVLDSVKKEIRAVVAKVIDDS